MYSDECSRHGVCSTNPSIAAFCEVLRVIISTSAYYINKLDTQGYDCEDMKLNIISSIPNLSLNIEYPNDTIMDIIMCHLNDLINLKTEYSKYCKQKGIKPIYKSFPLKFRDDMKLSDILIQGQKLVRSSYTVLTDVERLNFELIRILIKSACSSILCMYDYGYKNSDYLNKILYYILSKPTKNSIYDLSNLIADIWSKNVDLEENIFGCISENNVLTTGEIGKALLVSGSNLVELKNVLEALPSTNIYTNGDLLLAHSFEYFRNKANLKGHFSKGRGNYDFSVFPGAIYLTNYAEQSLENLVRGAIFTKIKYVPKGVKHVNSYDELFSAVQKSKGFIKNIEDSAVSVGYNFSKLCRIVESLSKYDYIIICDVINNDEKFCLKLKDKFDNSIIFGLSNSSNFKYSVNVSSVAHIKRIVDEFLKFVPANKIIFFTSRCNYEMISYLIYLSKNKMNNIYLSSCAPSVLNPVVKNNFMKLFKIKEN